MPSEPSKHSPEHWNVGVRFGLGLTILTASLPALVPWVPSWVWGIGVAIGLVIMAQSALPFFRQFRHIRVRAFVGIAFCLSVLAPFTTAYLQPGNVPAKPKDNYQGQGTGLNPDPLQAFPAEVENLSRLTNEQLRSKVASLAARMRVFQGGVSADMSELFSRYPRLAGPMDPRQQAMSVEFSRRSSQALFEFNSSMRPEALALREVMLRRQGRFPPYAHTVQSSALDINSLAGISPISDAAEYLESIARQLP